MLGKPCLGVFWCCWNGAFCLPVFKDEAEEIGQKLMLRDAEDLRLLSETRWNRGGSCWLRVRKELFWCSDLAFGFGRGLCQGQGLVELPSACACEGVMRPVDSYPWLK